MTPRSRSDGAPCHPEKNVLSCKQKTREIFMGGPRGAVNGGSAPMRMEIVTKRLLLRDWQETDAEALFGFCRDPAIGDGAGFPPHGSLEESRAILRQVLMQPENYAVVARESGSLVGSAGLILSLEGSSCKRVGDAEVGYWIGRTSWGRGYATEVVEALAAHAREAYGRRGLWGVCYPRNLASRRVLEKAGFTLHHREETYAAQFGSVQEALYYYRTL